MRIDIFTPEIRKRNNVEEITQKRIETVEFLTKKYNNTWPTEADMAKELAEKILPAKAISIVDARGRDGKRPDTMDTVAAWNKKFGSEIKTNKSILAISNQPYIPEQYIPLGVLDSSKFSFEVVGNSCNANEVKPELLLAAFAGGFYKELQLQKFRNMAKEEQKTVLPGIHIGEEKKSNHTLSL